MNVGESLAYQKEAYDRIAGHLDAIELIILEMTGRRAYSDDRPYDVLVEVRDMLRMPYMQADLSKRDKDLLIAGGINVIERLGALRQALDMAVWGLSMIAPEMYDQS